MPTLLLLCGILFFYRLADRDLWSSHEGRAAQDAQFILDKGRWGLPKLFDLQVEMQKPPLYYWLVALAAQAHGGQVDAWAVRLPAALSALGCVLLLYLFGLARGRPTAGFVAALALATMVHFTWLARIGRIDMPLTFAVTVALLCFAQGYWRLGEADGSGTWRWFLPAYLAVAVAVLLKGPIGIVLPGAVAVAFGLSEARDRSVEPAASLSPLAQLAAASGGLASLRACAWSLCWGVPLVLLVTVPWYWWAGVQTRGELFRSFFWYHNVERAFGGSGGLRAHPWWFYGPRLAVDLLPWSLALPFAVGWLLRRGRWRDDPVARFGAVWFVAVVAVLSCVRFKRADYALPAYPGAALLLGCAVERWLAAAAGFEPLSRSRRRLTVTAGLTVTVLGAVIGWCVYVAQVLPREEPARDYRTFAAAIRARSPAPEIVLFFRVEAHALAFHVGRPINTILEWENIDVWAGRPETHYVVMPPECVPEWPRHLTAGRLEEVLRSEDLAGGRHEHPLVLLRTVPATSGITVSAR